MSISGVTNGAAGATPQATTTITDDDPAPTVNLSVNNANIAEAAGVATFTATLSAVSGQDVTIDLGFTGTATLTTDYTRSGTQIVIPAGSTTGTVTVTAVQDTLDEAMKRSSCPLAVSPMALPGPHLKPQRQSPMMIRHQR